MSFQTSALILSWAAICILAMAVATLLGRVRDLTSLVRAGRSSNGMVGSSLPPLPDVVGGDASRFVRSEGKTVLLFLEQACSICERLIPTISKLAEENQSLSFVVVFKEKGERLGSEHVEVRENGSELFRDLNIPMTPFGALVGADGVIEQASRLGSVERLMALVEAASDSETERRTTYALG